MKRVFSTSFFLASLLISLPASGLAAPENKKHVVAIADFGTGEVPAWFPDLLQRHPELRVVAASTIVPNASQKTDPLVKSRRLEFALCLPGEPILPLLYETKISTPCSVEFSRPEDARDIVYRSQYEYSQARGRGARGLYLRSGVFSEKLIPDMKKMGLTWAFMNGVPDLGEGVYVKDGFFLVSAQKRSFPTAIESWQWIENQGDACAVLVLDGHDPLAPEILGLIAERLKLDPGIEMVTPQLLTPDTPGMQFVDDWFLETDVSPYLTNPAFWQELSRIRRAVEDYKNSGQAQLKTLDALNEGLYALYSFETIAGLQENRTPENEASFRSALGRLYGLLNLPQPFSQAMDVVVSSASASVPYSVDSDSSALRFVNSASSSATLPVRSFAVGLSEDGISYAVALNEPLPARAFRVDVYMDLNNHGGAGLTTLLPGLYGFLKTEDAWEFALRIEKDSASLYRAGRFAPFLLQSFRTVRPYEVDIPRSVLKGNPLRWGYQVITSYEPETPSPSGIEDFICREDALRQRILKQSPTQLPAVRAE